MIDDKDTDGVAQALRQGFRIGRRRQAAAEPPLDGAQALALAAYLDGSLTADERLEVEARLLLEADRLELLLASRAALRGDPAAPEPLPSDAVLQRAQALVPSVRKETQSAGVGAWLTNWFHRPLRPALGAAAFALYGLFCLQVFDWGVAGGEILTTAAAEEAAPVELAFALALDDLM